MKIYVTIPYSYCQNADIQIIETIKKGLAERLRKFYRAIEIEVSISGKANAEVYIMGNPIYPDCENDIKKEIVFLFQRELKGVKLEIKMNYQKIKPDFKPDPFIPPKVDNTPEKKKSDDNSGGEFDYEALSKNYHAETPRYSFDQVILPDSIQNQILEAIGIIEVEQKVFDEWGLRSIIPTATSALSFYGPPGTGKSMAAEAVAQKLGKKILSATYADIESKFHGEGPKMVKAIFRAAEREDAVLFLDESDSLLSKRLTNVSDGSAQAINSMRSQLLISLERFRGVVIFATNLVVNYDRAFLSRLINIEFTMPDAEARVQIWTKHIKGDNIRIPLGYDVDVNDIAQKYEFCGRDIKNAVKNACISVALSGRNMVMHDDFIRACEKTKLESEKVVTAKDHTSNASVLSKEQNEALKSAIQKQIDKAENVTV